MRNQTKIHLIFSLILLLGLSLSTSSTSAQNLLQTHSTIVKQGGRVTNLPFTQATYGISPEDISSANLEGITSLSPEGSAYQWHTFYGSSDIDSVSAVALDNNGYIYITGVSYASWNGPEGELPLHGYVGELYNFFVLKLDSLGKYQWHTFYGSIDGDNPNGIAIDSNNDIYITGQSYLTWNGPEGQLPLNEYNGGGDIFILKLDELGIYQWHTFYGSPEGDLGNGIIVDNNNGIYIAGVSHNSWNGPGGQLPLNPNPYYTILSVIKLDSSGSYQWHTFYGDKAQAHSIAVDNVNGLYIAGDSMLSWNGPQGQEPLHSHSGGSYWDFNDDITILKLTKDGEYQWHTFYGVFCGPYCGDTGRKITINGNSEVYIIGSSWDSWNGPDDQPPLNPYSHLMNPNDFILKLNSEGSYRWHTFHTGFDGIKGIDIDGMGGVYTTGSNSGIQVLKLDSEGSFQWASNYGYDVTGGGDIVVDTDNYLSVAGYSELSWSGPSGQLPLHSYSGSYDIVLLKLKTSGAYSISGNVKDYNGIPLSGVSITTDSGYSTFTNSWGDYMLSSIITGTHTLFPSMPGYIFSPFSRSISVPPDTIGLDFIGSYDPFSDSISSFVDSSRQNFMDASTTAFEVSVIGDYYLDKQTEHTVKLVVDATLGLFDMTDVDWGRVGRGINKINNFTTKSALHASWRGWTDSAAARHWSKPIYDQIHNNRQGVWGQFVKAGLVYYAGETAQAGLKDWMIDTLSPGFGDPVYDSFGEPAVKLGQGYRNNLLLQRDNTLQILPTLNLTPEQEAAYTADLYAREQANNQILAQLLDHRDLLRDIYQKNLEDEQSWLKFWGPLLRKWAVVGACTLAWDGAGYYVASTGYPAIETIYGLAANSRDLAHDQKMLDQSLRFLSGRLSMAYMQISLNTVGGLNLIRYGNEPQIAAAEIGDISLQSYGHYRGWPFTWWAEERSQVEIPLTNTTTYSNTYLTSAGYNHTGFWVGTERLLPEGQSLDLFAGDHGTAVIPFKMKNDGLSPDDGSLVDLLVLGATETGLYYVADTHSYWLPVRIDAGTRELAAPPAGYSAQQASEAPTLPYPLSSFVSVAPYSTDQQLTIAAFNPFSITVSAQLTQTIPMEFSILDAGDGQVIGNSIVWTGIISPQTDLEVRAILGWDGTPGEAVDLPGATLTYRDPNTGLGDSYTTTVEPVKAAWPLEVSIDIPKELNSNLSISIPVTITNLANYPALGVFTATISSLDGSLLWSDVIDINISATGVQLLDLPVMINSSIPYVVLRGEIQIGEVKKEEFFELLPNRMNGIYLPLTMR
jgi:hypothetical protein